MKNAEYLKMRMLNDKKRSINVAERYIQKELTKKYKKAMQEIKEELKSVLSSMAQSEGVSIAEMKRRIRRRDFQEIDFEQMAKEATKKASELAKLKDKIPKSVFEKLTKEQEARVKILNEYAGRGYMTRMELAQIHLHNIVLDLKQGEHTDLFSLFQKEYKDGFFRGVYHLQHSIGFGFDFVKPPVDAIYKVLMRDFSSKNFSERIWSGQKRLGRKLQDALSVGLIRGETPEDITKRLLKRVDVSFSDARRLVRTEMARVHEESSLTSYAQMDVEKYEFLATLDRKTSKICQEKDGKVYDVKEAKVGINMPPMHPNCRSTTVPYFEDDAGERFARNADGKGYMVPQDMTYKEWYGNLDYTEQNKMRLYNAMDTNQKRDDEQYTKYKNVLGSRMPKKSEFLKSKYGDGIMLEEIRDTIQNIKKAPLLIGEDQFGKKAGKHMREMGMDVAKAEDREKYKKLAHEVRKNYEVRKIGLWSGQDDEAVMYLKGDKLLITKSDGTFISLFGDNFFKGEIRHAKDNKRFKDARAF